MCTSTVSFFVPYPNEVAQRHRGPNHGSWGAQRLPTVRGSEDTEHQLQRQDQLHGHCLAGGSAVVDLGREEYARVGTGSDRGAVRSPRPSLLNCEGDTVSEPEVCATGSHHVWMPACCGRHLSHCHRERPVGQG